MFSKTNGFREVNERIHEKKGTQTKFRLIKIEGVPKLYFTNIIQYIYSDHFIIRQNNIQYFITLMIYADYFMLSRLQQMCQKYIKQYVSCSNVLQVMIIAHGYNSHDLEEFCIDFLCLNEKIVLQSRQWR